MNMYHAIIIGTQENFYKYYDSKTLKTFERVLQLTIDDLKANNKKFIMYVFHGVECNVSYDSDGIIQIDEPEE